MKVDTLIKIRKLFKCNRLISFLLKRKGIDLPSKVIIGNNVKFPHNSYGTVIHPNTIIGNNVKIYQNVTIGRADVHVNIEQSKMKSIVIEDNVIIGAGAKILCKRGTLFIRKGSIIGANAVILNSTEENGIYGGVPAKRIGTRNY